MASLATTSKTSISSIKSTSSIARGLPMLNKDGTTTNSNLIIDSLDETAISQGLSKTRALIYADMMKETIQKIRLLMILSTSGNKRTSTASSNNTPSTVTSAGDDIGNTEQVETITDSLSSKSMFDETARVESVQRNIEKLLQDCVEELETSGSFHKLRAFNKGHKEKRNELSVIKQNQVVQTRKLEKLKKEYSFQVMQFQRESEEMNNKIEILKDTLMELKQLCSRRQKFIKKQLNAKETCRTEECKGDEDVARKEIQRAKHNLEHEHDAHALAMDFLFWQRQQVETEIERMMSNYEQDIEAKTAELDQLKQRKTDTNDKYADLQMEYDNILRMVEDERAARKRAVEARKLLRAQIRAARVLQKWWKAAREARKAKKAAKPKKKK